MKRIGLILVAILLMASQTYSQTVAIPDTAFLHALIRQNVDTNGDSLISIAEAEAVYELDVSGTEGWGWGGFSCTGNIESLEGIEAFVNLSALDCWCNSLDNLDVSKNTALTYLDCHGNSFGELDLSKSLELEYLDCSRNALTQIDLSNNTSLSSLYITSNQLTDLEVTNHPDLLELACSNNQLSAIDLSGNPLLYSLDLAGNQLNDLDASGNPDLLELYCSENQLSSLSISGNTKLITLECSVNQIPSLDLSSADSLATLDCSGNQLTSLDVSKNILLTDLSCGENLFSSLDVSDCTILGQLDCWSNLLTTLTISNTALEEFGYYGGQLTELDLSGSTELFTLDCSNNLLSTLDVSGNAGLVALRIAEMPTLYEVCVWTTPFPTAEVDVDKSGSPNAYYTTECTYGVAEKVPDMGAVYPNPVTGMLTIELNYNGMHEIDIINSSGLILHHVESAGEKLHVDLSALMKGIYYITIRSNEETGTRKIIKL